MSKLHVTLKHVLATTTLTDPKDLAEAVTARLDPEDLDPALQEALVYWVRSHTARSRDGVPDELIGSTTGGTRNLEVVTATTRKPNRSAKVAGIRDWWQSFITERVNVDGVWKLTGDCTVEDIEALAASRREIASRNLSHADRYQALAARMRSEGVETVQDLGREKIADLAA